MKYSMSRLMDIYIYRGALFSIISAVAFFGFFSYAEAEDFITSNLTLGSSGEEVKLLQEWLSQDIELYPEQEVTGYYGPSTKEAVERYQRRSGIVSLHPFSSEKAIGSVGSITRASLNAEFSEQKTKIAWVEGGYGDALIYEEGEFIRPTRKDHNLENTHTTLSAWVGPLYIDKNEALIFGNGKGYGMALLIRGTYMLKHQKGKLLQTKDIFAQEHGNIFPLSFPIVTLPLFTTTKQQK